MALTTVDEGDVTIGLGRAREDLESRCGVDIKSAELMASSSAAGGLRMTVHGLTRDMTLRAAREASLGAGAVVVYTTSGEITEDDIDEIKKISPNLILLAGGVDYGEKEVVKKNAEVLSSLDIKVIYAGNVTLRNYIEGIFEGRENDLFICDNVYPKIDELNIRPVRDVIRKVFSDHIVTAPGMEKVKRMVTGDVIPTPGAVMSASELLYDEIGDLVVFDVGGATTDVHSVTQGSEKYSKMMTAPEPLAKRTVEGDLGVFINAMMIVKESNGDIGDISDVVPLPNSEEEIDKIERLTRWAVDISLWRHAGEIKVTYGAYGRNEIVEGKDLTAIKYIIGTGGALTRLKNGEDVLRNVKSDPKMKKLLPPKDAKVLIDTDYIMAQAGVMGAIYKDGALRLMKKSLGIR